jgi:hypothetical protein
MMTTAKSTVEIGSRLEMLVDDWLIERREGVELRLNRPRMEEVVWENQEPWEGPTSCYFVAMRDRQGVRLYYRGVDDRMVCMATSRDGIHFERPVLGLYEFEGSRQNNIVFQGEDADSFASHNFAPFIDTNPDALAEEKYKAIGGHRRSDGSGRELYGFTSADGIHWKRIGDAPIITEGKFDTLNVAFWDESAGLYRCYSRMWVSPDGAPRAVMQGLRGIQSCTSTDFRHWSQQKANIYSAGSPIEEFYTNATVPAPGAPHMLLSFPKRFVADRKKVAEHPGPGLSDTVFMTSRDGVHWDRTFAEALIRPGLDQRNWTERSNMAAWGIVPTSPTEWSIYVSEHYRWDDNRLRRYSIRREGFASVHAGAHGGEWTTRPLKFEGKDLRLNYSTSAAGSVRVEVLDEAGKRLEGHDSAELFGDELEAVVQWNGGGDLSALAGRAVRFRFVMRDADLFALKASS